MASNERRFPCLPLKWPHKYPYYIDFLEAATIELNKPKKKNMATWL